MFPRYQMNMGRRQSQPNPYGLDSPTPQTDAISPSSDIYGLGGGAPPVGDFAPPQLADSGAASEAPRPQSTTPQPMGGAMGQPAPQPPAAQPVVNAWGAANDAWKAQQNGGGAPPAPQQSAAPPPQHQQQGGFGQQQPHQDRYGMQGGNGWGEHQGGYGGMQGGQQAPQQRPQQMGGAYGMGGGSPRPQQQRGGMRPY